MICTCGLPMACVDSRPYAATDPKIVRLRVYRCRCGVEVATIEVRHEVEKIKLAIGKARRYRHARHTLVAKEA